MELLHDGRHELLFASQAKLGRIHLNYIRADIRGFSQKFSCI